MPNRTDEFVSLLKESLEDHLLSRSEKRNLKKELEELTPTKHEQQLLLSEVKRLVLDQTQEHKQQMLVNWMYDCFKVLNTSESDSAKSDILFSPGTACREAICSKIRFSKSTIRICVFTISDDEITEELLAAHRNGKKVSIITDNDKLNDRGSDIDRLERAGIPITIDKTDAHMHHKFALFDNEFILTGSYNWTRSAATRNHENVLILNDPKIFRAYEKEFESLLKELN